MLVLLNVGCTVRARSLEDLVRVEGYSVERTAWLARNCHLAARRAGADMAQLRTSAIGILPESFPDRGFNYFQAVGGPQGVTYACDKPIPWKNSAPKLALEHLEELEDRTSFLCPSTPRNPHFTTFKSHLVRRCDPTGEFTIEDARRLLAMLAAGVPGLKRTSNRSGANAGMVFSAALISSGPGIFAGTFAGGAAIVSDGSR